MKTKTPMTSSFSTISMYSKDLTNFNGILVRSEETVHSNCPLYALSNKRLKAIRGTSATKCIMMEKKSLSIFEFFIKVGSF